MKNSKLMKMMIRIAVIAAIIIIPLLYSYFYLGAFWDPYSRLDNLPVAVVNEDEGTFIHGEQRNIGQEMCNRLEESSELKFVFTDETDAKSGTEGDSYYAMIVIPENFSSDIASASSDRKQIAKITYSANEKRNYLASQILSRAVLEIEESIRGSVDSELVDKLASTINEVPGQMTELQDGLRVLHEGSSKLAEGAETLAEGTQTIGDKFKEYQSGINALTDGSDTLENGITSLDNGIAKLQRGAEQLNTSTKDLSQLTVGAKSLAEGAKQLNEGILQYTGGVDTLLATVDSTSAFLTQYVTKINPGIMKDQTFAAFIAKLSNPANAESMASLRAASDTLKAASAQISIGADQLSSGSANLPQLKEGIATLSAGLNQAKNGSTKLTEGSKTLSNGMNTAKDATVRLSDAIEDITDGAVILKDGTIELKNGIETAKTGVDTAITDTNTELAALEGLKEYAKAPVTVETTPIHTVPNYGTAFAPYFLSLSLWVGALIMFVGIYMDTEGKFTILTAASKHRIARSFLYLLIGFAQALALAFVLQYSLGLEIANPFAYYLACCLVSMVFIAIVQFLMIHLKDLGKFLSIVLLILQLTSCGGTFPMETVPKFFHILYPYMPMTYSVGLFKEVISGTLEAEAVKNIAVLIILLVVFMTFTVALSGIKSRKATKLAAEHTLVA